MKKELLRLDLYELVSYEKSINVGDIIITDFGNGPIEVVISEIKSIMKDKEGFQVVLEVIYEESQNEGSINDRNECKIINFP